MTVTRDPSYPDDYAQLMAAFNKVAEGHDALCVLNASLQMLSAAMQFQIAAGGKTLEEAEEYTGYVSGILLATIKQNYKRETSPNDVTVRPAQ